MPTVDEYVTAAMAAYADGDTAEGNRLADLADEQQARDLERLTSPGALASSAAWYAAQGIAIFPVEPRGKVPMPGLRWREQATADVQQVAAWWQANPQANIGMPTGLRWDVIDVDGPPGYRSLAQLREQNRVPEPLGRSCTPRGGMHLFVAVTGHGNAAGYMPGLDYRGLGGYVVLPPSWGSNGRQYQWDHMPVAP